MRLIRVRAPTLPVSALVTRHPSPTHFPHTLTLTCLTLTSLARALAEGTATIVSRRSRGRRSRRMLDAYKTDEHRIHFPADSVRTVRTLHVVPLLAAALLATACHHRRPTETLTARTAARVTALADSTFATLVDVRPEFATSAGLTAGPHGRLPDNTPVGIAAAQARWDVLRTAVAAVDPEPLVGRPQAILDRARRGMGQ